MTAALAIAALVAVFTAAVLFLRWFQLSQVFRPERANPPLKPDPASQGLEFDDIYFSGQAGQLHGWWVPAASPDAATIMICHGNAGNIAGRVETVAFFQRLGLNVFIFDYRGYGLSDGTPSERGLYDDANTAWRYLTGQRGIEPSRIVLLGRSLGGGVATHLALGCRPGAVLIESTFTSIADVARERYPRLPLWHLGFARFDNAARIAQIEAPLLLVHSEDDEVIPFRHGLALGRLLGDENKVVRIGGTHGGGYATSGDLYSRPVHEFLAATGHVAPLT